jgi:hypothetical protein
VDLCDPIVVRVPNSVFEIAAGATKQAGPTKGSYGLQGFAVQKGSDPSLEPEISVTC